MARARTQAQWAWVMAGANLPSRGFPEQSQAQRAWLCVGKRVKRKPGLAPRPAAAGARAGLERALPRKPRPLGLGAEVRNGLVPNTDLDVVRRLVCGRHPGHCKRLYDPPSPKGLEGHAASPTSGRRNQPPLQPNGLERWLGDDFRVPLTCNVEEGHIPDASKA